MSLRRVGSHEIRTVEVGGRTMQILAIRDSRHPWVITILLGCVISGILGLLLPPDPRTSIDAFMPTYARAAYYAVLLGAALVTLTGIFLPKLRDRLWVEMIGMWFVSGPLLIYPIAIIVIVGAPVSPAAVITCLFGVGGLARIAGIILELRALRIGQEQASA